MGKLEGYQRPSKYLGEEVINEVNLLATYG
jgi:hypothetical protein